MAVAPLFSVIVPTYARPERLTRCLEALAALAFPQERYEVVVSDDGSPVAPEALVARFAGQMQIRLVVGANAGPAAARNRGAAQSAGRYLVFTDDDCVPEAGWLTAYYRGFAEMPGHLLAGTIENGATHNRCANATHLITSYSYASNDRRSVGTRFFSTCNLGVSAEQFRRLGGFSEVFPLASGEDYDFCHRWQHAGMPAEFLPNAVVRHFHPLTLPGFCRQHFNYGRGLYLCRRRIAHRASTGFRFEAPSFYLRLLTYPLREVGGAAGWLYSLLIAGSQAATAAGAAREWLAAVPPSNEPAGVAVGEGEA